MPRLRIFASPGLVPSVHCARLANRALRPLNAYMFSLEIPEIAFVCISCP